MKLDVTSDKERVMVVPVFLVVRSQITPKKTNDGRTTCHRIWLIGLKAFDKWAAD